MCQLSRREREKQARELEIIEAAEKTFILKGFNDASMDEIAKEAQFTKRTVYQYFKNKEDLYFAVAIKGVKQLFSYIKEKMEKGNTGIEKARLIGEAYYQFSKDFPDAFRLMNFGQYIKANKDMSPNYDEIGRIGSMIFKTIAGVFEEGKSDKSISNELDTSRAVYSYFLLISGFFNRLSEVGDKYSELFKLNQDEIAEFTLELLTGTIRAK